jgi:hypothetical protein
LKQPRATLEITAHEVKFLGRRDETQEEDDGLQAIVSELGGTMNGVGDTDLPF